MVNENIAKKNQHNPSDINAFSDPFTRDFMDSTIEIEKGYYTFKSKTDKYTMLYPANAKMSEIDYTSSGENLEILMYSGDDDIITGDQYSVKIWYTNWENISLKTRLSSISTHVGYDGDYELHEFKDKNIYLSHMHNLDSNEKKNFYKIFGTVRSNTNHQTINFLYTFDCNNNESKYDEQLLEEHVLKLMNSITFKDNES